jgi:hypothetical protein
VPTRRGSASSAATAALSRVSSPAPLDRRPSTVLRRYSDRAAPQRAVGRGQLDAGLVLPPDYDARVAAGCPAALGYLARPDSVAQQLRATIQSVAAEQSRAFVAARLIVRAEHTSFPRALARARELHRPPWRRCACA